MFKCLPGPLIRTGMTENMGLGISNTCPSSGALLGGSTLVDICKQQKGFVG